MRNILLKVCVCTRPIMVTIMFLAGNKRIHFCTRQSKI